MNRILPIALVVCAGQLAACRTLAPADADPPPALRVELEDGSVLGLTPSAAAIPVHTEYADMAIPWVSVVEARSGTPLWTIRLRNGDQIRGAPTPADFTGSGTIEKVRIPYASILSLAPRAATPVATNVGTGPVRATIRLRDGSSLHATMAERGLRVRSAILGTLELAPSELRSVELLQKPAGVTLRNGDRIVGEPVSAKIGARTALGDMDIPVERIASILFDVMGGAAGLPDGLVAYYPLDAPDDSVRDASGNGNDGKATGARFADEGAVGGCFEFRGGPDAGDFIRVPHSPSLVSMQETRELTLCAWIQPRSIPREFPVIVGKGGNQLPDCFGGYELTANAYGDNDLSFDSGHAASLITQRAMGRHVNRRIGHWIHVALAIRSMPDSADFCFYVNGVASEFCGFQSGGDGRNMVFDVSNDLFIGGPDPRHHPNRSFFDGRIDEVMIFNRRLKPEEILNLYRRRVREPDRAREPDAAEPLPGERPRPGAPADPRRLS